MEQKLNDAELYAKILPFTWYFNATGKDKDGKNKESDFTGFSVKEGIIMTCAHGVRDIERFLKIKGRRLTLDEQSRQKVQLDDGCQDIGLLKMVPELDLALLSVKESGKNLAVAEFGDGELQFGQKVVHVGNVLGGVFSSSYLTGDVAFKCTNDVTLPAGNQTCYDFDLTESDMRRQYRILGHVYHSRYDWGAWNNPTKKMHPLLPIIQINRMQAENGCSGGPVCDTQGRVVGLLIKRATYIIAVHVSMLKEFLRTELEKHERSKMSAKVSEDA